MDSLLLVTNAFVRADGLDLVCAGTGGVELVSEPLLCQLPCQLETDNALTHAQDLGVVAQDGTLDRVRVVSSDSPDAIDLVGGDGDTETGAADEEGTVDLTASNLRAALTAT